MGLVIAGDRWKGDLRTVSSGVAPLADDEGRASMLSGAEASSTSLIFVGERGERGKAADGGVLAGDRDVCGDGLFCGEMDLARSVLFWCQLQQIGLLQGVAQHTCPSRFPFAFVLQDLGFQPTHSFLVLPLTLLAQLADVLQEFGWFEVCHGSADPAQRCVMALQDPGATSRVGRSFLSIFEDVFLSGWHASEPGIRSYQRPARDTVEHRRRDEYTMQISQSHKTFG